MVIRIHVYRCTKVSCRHIEEQSGPLHAQIRCDQCGSPMVKVAERQG